MEVAGCQGGVKPPSGGGSGAMYPVTPLTPDTGALASVTHLSRLLDKRLQMGSNHRGSSWEPKRVSGGGVG